MEQLFLTKNTNTKQLDVLNQQKKDICVKIYVAEHCQICDYAYEIAATIRENFPDVELQIVDMANPAEQIPENVFATPTYLLNGRVWSLGNPSPAQVNETLSDVMIDE